jgi:hypothetical protein
MRILNELPPAVTKEYVMPITPFLAGQAFDPETIEACDALHLRVVDDPATRFVAEKIIEWAQRGSAIPICFGN